MQIRSYCEADCPHLAELFYQTIHTVNAKDYTAPQLDAWASGHVELERWNRSYLNNLTLIAEEDGVIIGFGDIDETGYLDHLFVHRDHQSKGIASMLCDRLEEGFRNCEITTHASITAKPFFERRGYQVVREQQVERKGVLLTNYVMKKQALDQ